MRRMWLVLLALLLTDCAQPAATRGLPALPPAVDVLDWPLSAPVNAQYDGLLFQQDMRLRWRSPNPPATNYYEVWRSDAPYFTPESCDRCARVGVTTAQRGVYPAPNQTFVPDFNNRADPRFDIGPRMDFYIVRACNRAGCVDGEPFGLATWSALQRVAELPFP